MRTLRRMMTAGMCGVALAAALTAPANAGAAGDEGAGSGTGAGTGGSTGNAGSTSSAGAAESRGGAGGADAFDGAVGPNLAWRLGDSGSQARFRGLAAVNRRTAWVAGSQGTVLRTADGGKSWRNVSPPGAGALEFRDVEAFDGRHAVVLAIGEGEASRVFRTDDGGASWTESFRNTDPAAFYDCMTFFDARHGIALSDPVGGKYRILSTGDGGRSWRVLPSAGMPAAQPGEAAFAASGQCLVSSGSRDAWIATGGAATARVLHSADRGHTWTVTAAPIPAGDPARGVFGLAFRDARHGLAVGGDYRPGEPSPRTAATTGDGGANWSLARRQPPSYRSGVAWLPYSRSAALAVGPTGSELTLDGGRRWRTFDTGSYDTVDCAPDLSCWASGEKGRIARLSVAGR
ncbi:oxidoreductase [Streptomyces zagrosensis]|uniref:Photosystem II stability/assembly factor-like uncharacterized protein n=1 Tax=Streptomyces zagrosensis TaxID=1042984 RepID=A0A7W9V0H6_9ACTN|nr:oxidoreductase [Streptomyces zagrosensis]MBB5937276.1 photosystem II stability/assembly factor-like uncharacterized protein [Streptomyces zagrosensis]